MIAVAKKFCYCRCHAESRLGDAAQFRHWGRTASAYFEETKAAEAPQGVSTDDYIALVFACDGCRIIHKPAYYAPPPELKTEWIDPTVQPPPATGCDDSEGQE